MCGIIGVVGADDALPVLLDGLERLEYRGYDSAGVALHNDADLWCARTASGVESVAALVKACDGAPRHRRSGIGHTRWATHGAPGERNAHPQRDCSDQVAVIHNGIIENHQTLRVALEGRGHHFSSLTDTEVLAHRIEERRREGLDLEAAVRETLAEVQGAFAIAVIDAREPGVIVAARRVSPLIIGRSDGTTYLASDIPAVLDRATQYFAVDDDQICKLTDAGFTATDLSGRPVALTELSVDWDLESAQKGGFPDFMSKEIREQPAAVRATLADRVAPNGDIIFDELRVPDAALRAVAQVTLVGCGSSFITASVAKYAIERWARVPVEVDIASEFRYRSPVINDRSLVIGVSQSGETIDTITALREAKRRGAVTIAVTNIVGSSMAREADAALYTRAGLEVCVVATKTVLAQIVALELLALRLAQLRGTLTPLEVAAQLAALDEIPVLVSEVHDREGGIAAVASALATTRDFFFLGRHVGYPTSLEGALKLKEITYLHAEGYPAGELKHGPLALIEPGVAVFVVLTDEALRDKLLANLAEVKSRGATVIALVHDGDREAAAVADYSISLPRTEPLLSPLVDMVALQLFAYQLAVRRGLNVDRPRNLAKTVTVE